MDYFAHAIVQRGKKRQFQKEVFLAWPIIDLTEACVQELRCVFGAFGSQPWFITSIPGEIYIKKSWESHPFVEKVYLPNCLAVGPGHRVEALVPKIVVKDNFPYEEREITDEEFSKLSNMLR